MSRPAWAKSCTCGQTPTDYFCHSCMAWAGTSHGDQSSWSRPRSIDTPSPEDAPLPEQKPRVHADPEVEARLRQVDQARVQRPTKRRATGTGH